METKVTFTNFEHTPALDDRIEKVTEKFKKHLGGDARVEWFCTTHPNAHENEGRVHVIDRHNEYMAHATNENLYEAIDLAAHKMERQIKDRIEKFKGH